MKRILFFISAAALLFGSCSDFSDYNTVPVDVNTKAELTLWENISSNPQLSDFASVLKRVGYDKVLSESHTYTVWAPINGTFNADSLKNISDAKVVSQFVNHHIANYSHLESNVSDTVIFMLNEKSMRFNNKISDNLSFDGHKILATDGIYNHPSVNGMLYVMDGSATYRHNAYDIFSELGGVSDSLAKFVKRYETVTLDVSKSVPGNIIDGVQHYDDSVIVVSNSFTRATLGSQLDNEDSLYTVLIPTDEAWRNTYDKLARYYRYIPTVDYQDLSHTDVGQNKGGTTPTSTTGTQRATIMEATKGKTTVTLVSAPIDAEIQETAAYWNDSIVKRHITNSIAFSENDTYNRKFVTGEKFVEADTIRTTNRAKYTNLPHLDEVTQEVIKLSNGHARIISDFPYSPEESYLKVLKTRNVGRVVTATGSSAETIRMKNYENLYQFQLEDKDEDELRYVKTVLPEKSNFAPELDFYLPGVLSTTYDIYVVTVPGWAEPSNIENEAYVRRPYTLRADINYTDENNKQIAGRFDGETIKTTAIDMTRVNAFIASGEKVDTIKLGRVTFPICYAGIDARPNIKIMSTLSTFGSTNLKKYDPELRIANIILRPVELEENDENANKED